MLKFGNEPFLECSGKGDKRFSAFSAKMKHFRYKNQNHTNRSIEDIYQFNKIFEDGSTGLTWQEAKGRKAVNQEEVRKLYSKLWDEYFIQNPDFYDIIKKYKGFSDIFGQEGRACQAEEIYKIWIRSSEAEQAALNR